MSSRFINGARYAVSTTLAAAVTMTAVSNAAPPVALTATPPANGSIVVITSGWPDLTESVARSAGQVAATSFQLEGLDSTSLVRYPAGEGIGTFQVASGFTSLSQVRDVEQSGGDQEFFEFQYVEDASSKKRKKPTAKGAMDIKITLDYDPNLAWFAALIEADRVQSPVVLREILPAGDVLYYYGYISFNKVPTKRLNENMTVQANFSLLSDPIRYGA